MSAQRAVILVGSPHPEGKSASGSLAEYLAAQLEAKGVSVRTLRISHHYKEQGVRRLLDEITDADLFILAAPLYVDTLPYLVTHVFEQIAAERTRTLAPACRFLAIINCGFPEARHTYVALDVCRMFAKAAQFTWVGGLGLGGGETITGTHLPDLGWVTANVCHSLELTANALVSGTELPPEAMMLMSQPLVPARAYTLLGAARWFKRAFEHGVVLQLRAKPFAAGGGHSRL